MTPLLAEFGPWLAAIAAAVVTGIGIYFRAKAKGSSEAREEVAEKTNEQAAVAAKEVRNVDVQIDRLPDGGAADQLKRDWLRK